MAQLTDNCPMPTGKFKGDKMENVPAWYLLWIYDQNMCPQNVKNYIDENRQVLEKENQKNKLCTQSTMFCFSM